MTRRSSYGRRTRTRRVAAPLAAILAVPLASCTATATTAPDLARAGCPADIRVLLDGPPSVQHAAFFQLLGRSAHVSVAARSISAPLVVDGASTGVQLTLLFSDGFDGASPTERLYAERDLLLAAVDADLAIVDADQYPTVAVFAPLDRDPHVIMWDPEVYPDARTIAELGITLREDGSPVPMHGVPGDLALDGLVGAGLVNPGQPVADSDGTPTAITTDPTVAQQGDLTRDPSRVRLGADGHPPRYQTLDDAGYPRYPDLLSVRPDDVSRYADCLAALVPLFQQATIDVRRDGERADASIVAASAALGHPDYDIATARSAAEVLLIRRIVGNGADETVGNIEGGRMQAFFDVAVPALAIQGYGIRSGLRPADIATNAFIDPTIGF